MPTKDQAGPIFRPMLFLGAPHLFISDRGRDLTQGRLERRDGSVRAAHQRQPGESLPYIVART